MGRLAKRGVKAIFHNTLASSEYGLIRAYPVEADTHYM